MLTDIFVMSKVFSDFRKIIYVKNNKVVILVIIGVIVVTIGVIIMNNQESRITEVGNTQIQENLEDIEKINLENEYSPKPREWITSGPFQIDRSEYVLGEKIFMRIGGLNYDEKGEIVFLRALNNTHYSIYETIPFDGTAKSAFNYYLEPQLSKTNGYCTVDDFIGDWRIIFRDTDYKNLEFKITEKILPGSEESYQPVC